MIRERGLRQNWVADQLGMGQGHFSEIVRGIKPFPSEKIEELAGIIRHPIEDVVRVITSMAQSRRKPEPDQPPAGA